MKHKKGQVVQVTLEKIVGGGQALATMENGQKLFVWGGLPGETVEVQVTKTRAKMAEGIVVNVLSPSSERIAPKDPDSYLSTSPWQIMDLSSEQRYKSALIEEAFEMHNIVLPDPIEVYSDGHEHEYRNKIEFSWWWDNDRNVLDLAFFRRGSHGKIAIEHTSLAQPEIMEAAKKLRDVLREKNVQARNLKTLLIRSTSNGAVAAQLYVKEEDAVTITNEEFSSLGIKGLEIIYSNPKSPASVVTKRLQKFGTMTLTDRILDIPFDYAVEGFFQINLPVYEQALRDMKRWIKPNYQSVDLYSGVGSIGLTIGSRPLTLVEISEPAVNEMRRNIEKLNEAGATPVLATAESALEYIISDANIIVDPPRAGLHQAVIDRLIEVQPEQIIYLSCNPVTQARDVALLSEKYGVAHHRGYNFFPRTPHIEHLVVLQRK